MDAAAENVEDDIVAVLLVAVYHKLLRISNTIISIRIGIIRIGK